MKTNGNRRTEEILREIESTRTDMDHTLTAIERKLTPGQLVDQGLDYLRGSGANEFVHNLGGSVKQNPLPVALMGIGLAWLMASGRNGSTGPSGHAMGDWAAGTGSRMSQASGTAKERLGQATDSARERIGQARQSLSDTAQSTRERLSRTADSARHQLDRAREGYDWMVREQPLALGAIGVAIGALFAAAAPRTRKEDELMGETRDRLMAQAKDTGKAQLDKAKEVADKAASAATGEAQRQGMAPSSQFKGDGR
jgi:ElaB/YqjD/DUF883 family membrane-anchored ribosome-binding protein